MVLARGRDEEDQEPPEADREALARCSVSAEGQDATSCNIKDLVVLQRALDGLTLLPSPPVCVRAVPEDPNID
jgi:hypothetical protein